MNKIIAQTVDKMALSILTPLFTLTDETATRNQTLLQTPVLPPSRVDRVPKVFRKMVSRTKSAEISHFTFESQTRTSSTLNNTVHGRYYSLAKKQPRSTAILLHGLCERNYRNLDRYVNSLLASGHDCVTMALPYHLERCGNKSSSGKELMGADLRDMLEGINQSVKDVFNIVNWLSSNSIERIGIIGVNIGAYVAALVSCMSERLAYSALVAPLTVPIQTLGFAIDEKRSLSTESLFGLSGSQLDTVMTPWELYENEPVVKKDRIMIISAQHMPFSLGNAIAKLWGEWGISKKIDYRCGYLELRRSKQVVNEVIAFVNNSQRNIMLA
jgi:dienelactone hydrolase